MPRGRDLETELTVLLEDVDFESGLENLDKADLIDLVLKLNHAARNRERWLNDLFKVLGPEVAGTLPVGEELTGQSVLKALRVFRAQRDEAFVRVKRLTGKEPSTRAPRVSIVDAAHVLLSLLTEYRKSGSAPEIERVIANLRSLLSYVNVSEGVDGFVAQKKHPVKAKHIGEPFAKKPAPEAEDSTDSLADAPQIADLEAFLQTVSDAHQQEVVETSKQQHLDSVATSSQGSDLIVAADGSLPLLQDSDELVKERIKNTLAPKYPPGQAPLSMPDYGTNLDSLISKPSAKPKDSGGVVAPGVYVDELAKAKPGEVIDMSQEDFAALQTVASGVDDPFTSVASLQSMRDSMLALAAGDDDPKKTYGDLQLSGTDALPEPVLDADDFVPPRIVPMMATRPLTAGQLVTIEDVIPLSVNQKPVDKLTMRVIKEREPSADGDVLPVVIDWDWDGQDQEVEVEPEEDEEDQLF